MRKNKQYNRIKGALGDHGVSNMELAEALKISPTTVSNWCTNTKQPGLITLYEIADFLQMDVRDLLVPNKLAKVRE